MPSNDYDHIYHHPADDYYAALFDNVAAAADHYPHYDGATLHDFERATDDRAATVLGPIHDDTPVDPSHNGATDDLAKYLFDQHSAAATYHDSHVGTSHRDDLFHNESARWHRERSNHYRAHLDGGGQ